MRCTKLFWTAIGLVVTLLFAFVPAEAGPPLICWPYEIGGAKSLPWGGSGWGAAKAGYDLNRLADDTQALLSPDVPVIVRMETLRRATVYAMKDQRIAQQLLSRLLARAQQGEAKGKLEAMAFFDAGYLVEAYKQGGRAFRQSNQARDLDGYGMVLKAINLRGTDPEMEFAAVLISFGPRKAGHYDHLRNALAGASDGSLLARNLVSHSHLLGLRGNTVTELRTIVANTKY